jgi:poly(3-hydroxybutyrate) depolymerase
MRPFSLALGACLAVLLAAPPSKAEGAEGREEVQAEPFKSSYIVQTPKGYTKDRSWPLVVALHGMGGEAKNFAECWAAPAANAGFFVAVPNGDAQTPCRCGQCDGMVRTWSLRSEKFILWMIGEIRKKYEIDDCAVFLSGFSAGAQLALYLAVRNPGVFAGTVPVGGGTIRGIGPERLRRAKSLPVLLVAGGRDPASGMVAASGERLKELGFGDVTVQLIPGIGHEFPLDRIPHYFEWFSERREARKLHKKAMERLLHEGIQGFEAGSFARAISMLRRVEGEAMDPAQAEKAGALLEKAEKLGEKRLWDAAEKLLAGDRAGTLEAYRAICEEFAGLKCAKKAAAEMKALLRGQLSVVSSR